MSIFAVLLVVLFSAPVFAQSGWEHYTFEGNNSVNDICEDNSGNIWVATGDNIHMFDGTQWTSADQNAEQIDFHAIGIAASPNGGVWAKMPHHGIVTNADGDWQILEDNENHAYLWKTIAIDTNNTIWVAYDPEKTQYSLRRYDGHSWFDYTGPSSIKRAHISNIETSETGSIWISAGIRGLFRTHVDTPDSIFHIPDEDLLNDTGVRNMALGPTGDVWVLTSDKVSHYDGNVWEHISKPSGGFTGVEHFAVDNNNILWVLHPIDYLCSYKDSLWLINQYYDGKIFNDELSCNVMYIDSFNRLWIGTREGIHYYQLEPSVVDVQEEQPQSFTLSPPTPNPFNPTTTISYTLTESSPVSLAVYNVSGQKVVTLIDERQAAGMHTATFDGTGLASGLYFARIETEGMVQTEKMVLMK